MERFVVLVELIVLELKFVVVVVEVIVVVVVASLLITFCNHTTAWNCHNMFAILPNVSSSLSMCVFVFHCLCVCCINQNPVP